MQNAKTVGEEWTRKYNHPIPYQSHTIPVFTPCETYGAKRVGSFSSVAGGLQVIVEAEQRESERMREGGLLEAAQTRYGDTPTDTRKFQVSRAVCRG